MINKQNNILMGFGLFIAFAVMAFSIYTLLGLLDTRQDAVAFTASDAETVISSASSHNGTAFEGRNIIDPPRPITDFTFVANNGEPLSRSDLSGRYVLLAFGYTHCPDVCPATLLEFRQIKRALDDLSDDVVFMFISVDPERDTPEFLDRYIKRYDESFIALSGDQEGLEVIAPEFGLFWDFRTETNSAAGYIVDHTASRYLLSPDGELIRMYSFTTDPTVIEADLRDLLIVQS